MNKDFLLAPIPLPELIESIRVMVREEVRQSSQADLEEKLLSPKEVCEMFTPKISEPTLRAYCNQAKLKSYRFGKSKRIFYKYSEVIHALKEIKKYSRQAA